MKVYFETFGCRLNRAEALEQEATYLARGWTVAESHAEADLIILRGCSVTARAQSDCEKLISHLKRHYPLKRLIVTGCLDRDKYRDASGDFEKPDQTAVPTRTARAYLKVQDGCSGKCSFCIVPRFRGPSRSVDFGEVLDRARRMIDAGYHEIVVTGCNLALYASHGKRLPELLVSLANLTAPTHPSASRLPSSCRIRLGSIEPGECARDVVDAIAENPNLCRFIHLPIQSGSQGVLAAMRRGYSIADVEKLLDAIENRIPAVGLGCDLIAGFPGETAPDHFATCGLVKRHPFSTVHVFPFSPRPGTIAAGLYNQLPSEIRHARARELADLGKNSRLRFARTFVGKNVEIVSEGHNSCHGRTSEYLPCRATGLARRKKLVSVHVTSAHSDGTLEGAAIRDD